MHPRIVLCVTVVLLAGCGAAAGSGASQPPAPPPPPPPAHGLVITGLAIIGEGLDGTAMTVRGRSDQDPAPASLRVAFVLDGADLPRDPDGGPWHQDFPIRGDAAVATVVVDLAP